MKSPAPFGRRFDLLVTYDVDTTSSAGRRRLRRVAKVCEGVGQRVQLSVFECRVDRAQWEALKHRLKEEMNPEEDSLRIYVLYGGRSDSVFTYGRDDYRDFDEPLIL